MSNLNRRVEKLEKQAGVGEDDWMNREKHPAIAYWYDAEAGEAGAEAARKKATAEWEAENGPLDGREPFYIERRLVSPGHRKAEAEPDSEAIPEPKPASNVTPFLAR